MRRAAVIAALVGAAAGCSGSRGNIFERIDAATPPGSNLRVDVFLLRSVSTCAVGAPCSQGGGSGDCFFLSGGGQAITFDPDTLAFLPPGDPAVGQGPQTACFRLAMDDASVTRAGQLFAELRADVFQASRGDINLDVRLHQLQAIDAGFSPFHSGLFLEPAALEAAGLPEVDRETDMVFALTGVADPGAGLSPNVDPCSGTNWLAQGVLGASTYSWIDFGESCARTSTLLRAFFIQLFLGLRDIDGLPDLYAGGYPSCGRGAADRTAWFPHFADCTQDPDAPSCGAAQCADLDAFYRHVLAVHWPRGRSYNGNHCSDGRMDHGETGVDTGGVCDLLGR